jgi:hypothetical protein
MSETFFKIKTTKAQKKHFVFFFKGGVLNFGMLKFSLTRKNTNFIVEVFSRKKNCFRCFSPERSGYCADRQCPGNIRVYGSVIEKNDCAKNVWFTITIHIAIEKNISLTKCQKKFPKINYDAKYWKIFQFNIPRQASQNICEKYKS